MPDTFHLFPILPQELRLAIWSIALKESRIVAIRKRELYEYTHKTPGPDDFCCFNPCDPPPVFTQVCFESRLAALKVYTRAFPYGLEPRYTYINFSLDRLIIPDFDLYYVPSSAPERRILQRLVVTTEDTEKFFMLYLKVEVEGARGARGLTALKELTCVGEEWENCSTKDEERRLKTLFDRSFGHEEGWECPRITVVPPGVDAAFGARMREEDED